MTRMRTRAQPTPLFTSTICFFFPQQGELTVLVVIRCKFFAADEQKSLPQ